jgi:hypothetical protein
VFLALPQFGVSRAFLGNSRPGKNWLNRGQWVGALVAQVDELLRHDGKRLQN